MNSVLNAAAAPSWLARVNISGLQKQASLCQQQDNALLYLTRMNIFWIAAIYYGSKHFKIILEITQLLYTAHHCSGNLKTCGPEHLVAYKKTHEHSQIARWVRASGANYLKAVEKALELLDEFEARNGKKHGCALHIEWLERNVPSDLTGTTSIGCLTVAPVIRKGLEPYTPASWKELAEAYEEIYRQDKREIALQMGKCPTGVVRAPAPFLFDTSPHVDLIRV